MKKRLAGIVLLSILVSALSTANAAEGDVWIPADSGCMVAMPAAVSKTVKVSWTGACSDGYADGKGVLTWSNGNRYEGDVLVGTINGKGAFFWANGDWYEGEFKDGRRDGTGTQHFGCTGTYRGQFRNGVMDGIGVLDMADGNHYEGSFRNGQMEGLGMRRFADGSKYEGEFKRNQREGIGALELGNHFVYEGEFKADQIDGHILMTDVEKTVYEGSANAGHVEGRGIMTKANGERDIGIFKENKDKLKLISNIGPPLYEPCSNHCSSTTLSCTNMETQISMIRPDDPMFQNKAADVAATCGRDLKICENICKHENPTVRELKGVVEINEIDDPKVSGASSKDPPATREEKLASGKVAIGFVEEQSAITRDLRTRLSQQREQIKTLQLKISTMRTVSVDNLVNKPVDCKAVRRKM